MLYLPQLSTPKISMNSCLEGTYTPSFLSEPKRKAWLSDGRSYGTNLLEADHTENHIISAGSDLPQTSDGIRHSSSFTTDSMRIKHDEPGVDGDPPCGFMTCLSRAVLSRLMLRLVAVQVI